MNKDIKILKSQELHVKEYLRTLGINPQDVFYDRVTCNNISTSRMQWSTKSAKINSLLSCLAYVEVIPTIQKQRSSDGAAYAFNGTDRVMIKPGFPIHNASNNISVTLNSFQYSFDDPSRIQEIISLMYLGGKENDSLLPSKPLSLNGRLVKPSDAASPNDMYVQDDNYFNNVNDFFYRSEEATGSSIDGQNDIQLSIWEPLLIPPFNPCCLVKGLPENSPFKGMSQSIPHVNNLALDFKFENLTESLLWYLSSDSDLGGGADLPQLEITNMEAVLHLWWYTPRMQIPKELSIQAWAHRYFIKAIGSVGNFSSGTIESDQIRINKSQDLYVIHMRRDRSQSNYVCGAYVLDDTSNVVNNSSVNNSYDEWLSIDSVDITFLTKDRVVNSTNLTSKELYRMTMENCTKDFPYKYRDWRGKVVSYADTDGSLGDFEAMGYSGRPFIALNPGQLAGLYPSMVLMDTNFKISVNYSAKIGHPNLTYDVNSNLDYQYELVVSMIRKNVILQLSENRGLWRDVLIQKSEADKIIANE